MYRKRAEEGLTLLPRVGQGVGAIIATLASGRLPYHRAGNLGRCRDAGARF